MTTVFRSDTLANKVALITGGGTGIGLGIARQMVRCGAKVALASRNMDHLEHAVTELEQLGGSAIAVQANVRERSSLEIAVSQSTEAFGGLDILVNNAAGNFYAPSATLSPNAWKAVVETDLYGTFYGCQAAYPAFKERGSGTIISISMTLHYRGWPLMAHATAAKAGVDALTRTLALEWARDDITVNAIAPGPILTEGVRKAFSAPTGEGDRVVTLDERVKSQIPLGRLGSPSDIGEMAVFLGSAAGRWVTGAIFVVDGGSWLSKV